MLRRAIHSLERSHWRRETRRVTRPFAWGTEYLGGPPLQGDAAREFLRGYADHALASSEEFYSVSAAELYQFDGETVTFPSSVPSPYPENNLVTARWFPAAESRNGRGPGTAAVVVLPQWNAQPDSHVNICRVLARCGLSALRLSLPYHDNRMPAGLERADYLVSPNIGLTLQANQQAVQDTRRALGWLEQQGYTCLGILGTSIGSSVAFITLAHEPALRAFVGLHVSTYFADVVRAGLTTAHVWAGLEGQVTEAELRHYWSPISPFPYVGRLRGAGKKMLLVSARYDLSFPPEFSETLWTTLAAHGIPHEVLQLPCGHYTLGRFPFSYWAGLRFVPFLRRALF